MESSPSRRCLKRLERGIGHQTFTHSKIRTPTARCQMKHNHGNGQGPSIKASSRPGIWVRLAFSIFCCFVASRLSVVKCRVLPWALGLSQLSLLSFTLRAQSNPYLDILWPELLMFAGYFYTQRRDRYFGGVDGPGLRGICQGNAWIGRYEDTSNTWLWPSVWQTQLHNGYFRVARAFVDDVYTYLLVHAKLHGGSRPT